MKPLPVVRPSPRYGRYMRERDSTNWENYIRALREAGRAVEVGPLVVDGESVFRRRLTCDTRTCSPTRDPATGRPWRESAARSCCADLTVDLSPIEVAALERRWGEVRAFLASKDRFFEGKSARDCLELSSDFELSLRHRGGRCIFALRDGEWGLRCGIHAAALARGIPVREVKPVVCDTFPLLIMDLQGGCFYVGAHDRDSEGIAGLGDTSIDQFPCLAGSGRGKPVYLEMEETLRAYFGDALYEALRRAAGRYLAGPRPKRMKLP